VDSHVPVAHRATPQDFCRGFDLSFCHNNVTLLPWNVTWLISGRHVKIPAVLIKISAVLIKIPAVLMGVSPPQSGLMEVPPPRSEQGFRFVGKLLTTINRQHLNRQYHLLTAFTTINGN